MADGGAFAASAAARHASSPRHPVFGLVGWVLICLAAGAVGGFATSNAPGFYAQLVRPDWAPPASVFGPVWTVLYLAMGVAAWLVWRRHGVAGRTRAALGLFIVQLGVNALWTWLFFAWHQGAGALVCIVVLWLLIVTTIAAFWPLNRVAAALLVPYLLWVSFASALTWTLWRANPAVLG
jgi:translocator protein